MIAVAHKSFADMICSSFPTRVTPSLKPKGVPLNRVGMRHSSVIHACGAGTI